MVVETTWVMQYVYTCEHMLCCLTHVCHHNTISTPLNTNTHKCRHLVDGGVVLVDKRGTVCMSWTSNTYNIHTTTHTHTHPPHTHATTHPHTHVSERWGGEGRGMGSQMNHSNIQITNTINALPTTSSYCNNGLYIYTYICIPMLHNLR